MQSCDYCNEKFERKDLRLTTPPPRHVSSCKPRNFLFCKLCKVRWSYSKNVSYQIESRHWQYGEWSDSWWPSMGRWSSIADAERGIKRWFDQPRDTLRIVRRPHPFSEPYSQYGP